jgi:hypothetical protein
MTDWFFIGRARVSFRWGRLALLGVAAFLAIVSGFWLGSQAVNDLRAEAEGGRLRLARLAAQHADHILAEAFFELELTASVELSGDGDTGGSDLTPTNFNDPIVRLDRNGSIVDSASDLAWLTDDEPVAAALRAAAESPDRNVSQLLTLAATGHPSSAVSLPLFDDQGRRLGTIVGFLDLEEHVSDDLAEIVQLLGTSAHADIVGPGGVVLASTEHLDAGVGGNHPADYQAVTENGLPVIFRSAVPGQSPEHVMAYAPMGAAPWGVALGASTSDTFRLADDLRRLMYQLGAATVATLIVAIGLVSVRIRRPDDDSTSID